ncbi:MAG: hypothetical protein WC492_02315 [Candidatus Micrarchaeia archaeon]
MDKKQISQAIETALEEKGKRKFTQTVEAVFNFKGLDVSKPENRINMDIILPKGRGKDVPIIAFAEQQAAMDAQKAGAVKVLGKADIEKLKVNKKELKKMASESEFVATPQLMIEVGKNLGQVLGGRGKLPRPVAGSMDAAIKQAKARVRLQTRGKYLPTIQCAIGTEAMSVSDLVENFDVVYEKIREKVGESAMGALYVKLTMGKAIRMGQKQAEETAAKV